MLSVLVVYKDKNRQRPGPGFFEMGRDLGYELLDEEARDAFRAQQTNVVYDANRKFGNQ